MAEQKQKHVPERKCAGCGEHFPKSTLIRIVRTPEGQIVLDATGKISGRGAYICKSATCLNKAIKSSRIDRSLETSVPKDVYERLKSEIHNV